MSLQNGSAVRDGLLVTGGAFVLISQFFIPLVPSMGYAFLVLGAVPFLVAIMGSRYPFALAMLPAAVMVLATYGREVFVGRLPLISENVGNLMLAILTISLVSVWGAGMGVLARRLLRVNR